MVDHATDCDHNFAEILQTKFTLIGLQVQFPSIAFVNTVDTVFLGFNVFIFTVILWFMD